MKKQLVEGIKFNNKIKEEVLSDSNIKCGVEFEFLDDEITRFLNKEEMSTTQMLVMCSTNFSGPEFFEEIDEDDVPAYEFSWDGNEYILCNDDRDNNGDVVLVGLYNSGLYLELTKNNTLGDVWNEIFSEDIIDILKQLSDVKRIKNNEDYFNSLEVLYLQEEANLDIDELDVIEGLVGSLSLTHLKNAITVLIAIEASRINGEPPEEVFELINEVDMKKALSELDSTASFDIEKSNKTLAVSYEEPINDDEINSDYFNFGEIEYALDNIGVGYESVELDHNSVTSPIEIIGSKQDLRSTIHDIESVSSMIREHDMFHTDETCGMHVSLSYKDGEGDFNTNKFITLLNAGRVSNLFKERMHISDLMQDVIKSFLSDLQYQIGIWLQEEISKDEFLQELEEYTDLRNVVYSIYKNEKPIIPEYEKYQAVNLSELWRNGRVELRYFGGGHDGSDEYYENREDMIDEIIRAAYMLRISFSDDYDKEYRKALVQLSYRASDIIKKLYKSIKTNNFRDAKIICTHNRYILGILTNDRHFQSYFDKGQ